ncbi:glycine--tRNA ligase [bacterium]|nr:glycine--tRNA ligase [bacterium]
MNKSAVTMDQIVSLAKQRGFVFPGSDIYGGLANSWDYGPLGSLLKNNIQQAWWQRFVERRRDMVGVDTALIMNPKVWEASGHVETFADPLVECKKCHTRFRADHIDTDKACESCGESGQFTDPAAFNLMFRTFIGPKEDAAAQVYLRPETAQGMFVDWPLIQQTSRKRIPFGVAQIGHAFRNEITPGNFIFRTREFDIMELEYFIHPDTWEEHFDAWLQEMRDWTALCGMAPDSLHEVEIAGDDLAHYSKRTVDIEFDFPFGQEELYGLAYRTDFDLSSHGEASGQDMAYTDPDTGEQYIPHVIEPTFGVNRTFLAMLVSAYTEEKVEDETRTVLRLPAWAAPYKVAVLPLSKKEELTKIAEPLADELGEHFSVDYDITQSIGKRYRRQDEIGTPYCVTVDFESLEDKQVTIRERDTMMQERVPLADLPAILQEKLS